MSAEALNLFNHLRQNGVAENLARQLADALDARIAEVVREHNRRAEQAAAEAAEKIRAEAVPASEYHRRMENTPTREESESKFAELKGAIRELWSAVEKLRAEMGEVRVALAGMAKELQYLRWGVYAIIVILLAEFIGKFLG